MRSLKALQGKFIGSVIRLPIGAVALADHEGKTFAMINMAGLVCDESGEHFDQERVPRGPARKFGTDRFKIHETNTCELSPIGVCIGDYETDEAECVFCRAPEEQK